MKNLKKDFVYLISTPGRLDPYFENFKSDKADVIALSWRNFDSSWHNHIDGRGTTPAQGRNLILKNALKSGPYKYFIFVDDDVRLDFVPEFKKHEHPHQNFESFLIDYQPAACSIVNPLIGRGWATKKGLFNTVHYFDGQFIAYHIETLGTAKPYATFATEESCQYVTISINAITTLLYPNNKIQYNGIYIRDTYEVRRNFMHYPRNHGAGSKYGKFGQFSDTYVKPAMGQEIPQWHSCENTGEPQRKKGSYYNTKEDLASMGFNLKSEIWESIFDEWMKIKPTWWDRVLQECSQHYLDNPDEDFWIK